MVAAAAAASERASESAKIEKCLSSASPLSPSPSPSHLSSSSSSNPTSASSSLPRSLCVALKGAKLNPYPPARPPLGAKILLLLAHRPSVCLSVCLSRHADSITEPVLRLWDLGRDLTSEASRFPTSVQRVATSSVDGATARPASAS